MLPRARSCPNRNTHTPRMIYPHEKAHVNAIRHHRPSNSGNRVRARSCRCVCIHPTTAPAPPLAQHPPHHLKHDPLALNDQEIPPYRGVRTMYPIQSPTPEIASPFASVLASTCASTTPATPSMDTGPSQYGRDYLPIALHSRPELSPSSENTGSPAMISLSAISHRSTIVCCTTTAPQPLKMG